MVAQMVGWVRSWLQMVGSSQLQTNNQTNICLAVGKRIGIDAMFDCFCKLIYKKPIYLFGYLVNSAYMNPYQQHANITPT
jgi:hypothetical protein